MKNDKGKMRPWSDIAVTIAHELGHKASLEHPWKINTDATDADAKQLLGYLLIIESNISKNFVHQTFHDSLQHLLEPINFEYGVDLKINGETFWFYSRVSIVIAD